MSDDTVVHGRKFARVWEAVQEFEKAVRADTMAGSMEPSDGELARAQFRVTKEDLLKLLKDEL